MCLAATYWARMDRLVYGATRADAAGIGFDDEALYQGMNLPIRERSLPMEQMLHSEAVEVFEAWRIKADKVAY
jgi:tRNA(Arg) A34 adenosine deaminase TadA